MPDLNFGSFSTWYFKDGFVLRIEVNTPESCLGKLSLGCNDLVDVFPKYKVILAFASIYLI